MKRNCKVSANKLVISASEIAFFWTHYTKDGIKLISRKIKVIIQMKPPEDNKQ